ncbi:MAG: hypothetical protein ABI923_09490 [bacterium]
MKHHRQIIHFTFMALLISVGYACIGTLTRVAAQEQATDNKKVRHDKSGRDPFKRYEPPAPKTLASLMLLPPSIQERIDRYKAQKIAAMNARLAAPKPTTALLLAEVQVIGIFRTPRGYAAMVEALPIKLSYVIYPGETFFDGQLVAIEENRLVFRREIVWASGKRERVVEIKPLRQSNPVDAMTATKVAPAAPVAEPEKKPDYKSAAPDKQ